MVVYKFSHFEIEGQSFPGPEITLKVMGDVTVTATYYEEDAPEDKLKVLKDIIKVTPVVVGLALLRRK